jgi:hypothetical protein
MQGRDVAPAPRPPDSAHVTTPVAAGRANRRHAPSWFRKKRFVAGSAVLVVFVVIMIATGGNDPKIFDFTTTAAQSQAESAMNTRPVAAIGQSVRDGQFSFIVTSMAPPSMSLTDRFGATQTAQGEFVVVRLNVTNIGYEVRSVTATNQFLIGAQGQRFATSAAASSLQGTQEILREKINPGNTVYDVPLLFDVTPGTTIADIELHDSASSAGVKVSLH